MSLERIWKHDYKCRRKEEFRRRRVRLNWPAHAKRIAEVFRNFTNIADQNGIPLYVYEYSGNFREALSLVESSTASSAPWGSASVTLVFGNSWTEEGIHKRSEQGIEHDQGLENGARLVIHFSEASGVVQVFINPPYRSGNGGASGKAEGLLIEHTYNTDDLTESWAQKQIEKLLVLNRVESIFYRPNTIDKFRVRLWRFLDIRNRRGYLDAFRHFFTPWELVMLAAATFAVGIWVSVA